MPGSGMLPGVGAFGRGREACAEASPRSVWELGVRGARAHLRSSGCRSHVLGMENFVC
jgi:hypothetical protein